MCTQSTQYRTWQGHVNELHGFEWGRELGYLVSNVVICCTDCSSPDNRLFIKTLIIRTLVPISGCNERQQVIVIIFFSKIECFHCWTKLVQQGNLERACSISLPICDWKSRSSSLLMSPRTIPIGHLLPSMEIIWIVLQDKNCFACVSNCTGK